MTYEQPDFIPPSIIRLPQIPPAEVSLKRRGQLNPLNRDHQPSIPGQVNVTPKPGQPWTIGESLPATPPAALPRQAPARTPYPHSLSTPGYPRAGKYATGKTRRKEPGTGELLLGCGVLLAAGLLVVVLLYYLSAAM